MSMSFVFAVLVVGMLVVGLLAAGLGRLVGSVGLLGLMAFSAFGFLSCFEPGQASIPWLLVYVLGGLLSSVSFFQLNFRFDRFDRVDT